MDVRGDPVAGASGSEPLARRPNGLSLFGDPVRVALVPARRPSTSLLGLRGRGLDLLAPLS